MSSLAGVSTDQLRALRHALERGRVGSPPTLIQLQSEGFGAIADSVAKALAALGPIGAAAALGLLIADREERSGPALELVWTGPEPRFAQTRDTEIVLRELFASAGASVLVAGYAFDHGERILAPLHRVMRERDVRALLFLDLRAAPDSAGDPHLVASRQIDDFLERCWPFGPPRPDIYYDPRTLSPGARVSLHAKCAVADRRRTLITSANFTDRGQTRNVELGVLIEDPRFGEQLCSHWHALVAAGLMHPYQG